MSYLVGIDIRGVSERVDCFGKMTFARQKTQ